MSITTTTYSYAIKEFDIRSAANWILNGDCNYSQETAEEIVRTALDKVTPRGLSYITGMSEVLCDVDTDDRLQDYDEDDLEELLQEMENNGWGDYYVNNMFDPHGYRYVDWSPEWDEFIKDYQNYLIPAIEEEINSGDWEELPESEEVIEALKADVMAALENKCIEAFGEEKAHEILYEGYDNSDYFDTYILPNLRCYDSEELIEMDAEVISDYEMNNICNAVEIEGDVEFGKDTPTLEKSKDKGINIE